MKAASELVKLSDTRGLAPQYARLLLELSRARLGAEPASPVGALPHALRCLAVCESYSLDAIHASAMTHLAQVGTQGAVEGAVTSSPRVYGTLYDTGTVRTLV